MAQHVMQQVTTYNVGGQYAQSVWHWRFEIGGFSSSYAAALQFLNDWNFRNVIDLTSILPADVTLLSQKAKIVDMAGGFEGFRPYAAGTVGGRGAGMSCSGLAPVVIFSCEHADHAHGRWYIPGIAEGDCVEGIFTDAYKALIETKINLMFDDLTLTAGGLPVCEFVLWDRKNKVYAVPARWKLSDVLGQQRRRQTPV